MDVHASVALAARVCHEVNRAYCGALGDNSQPSWDDAPEWQRESATQGVLGIVSGDVAQPSDAHESWLKHKDAEGWRYGDRKDADARTHPCMVPYAELPPEQQVKDALFFAAARAVLIASRASGLSAGAATG